MADILTIQGGKPLKGQCRIPGDKSISHRAVMFSAIADGHSRIRGFLDGGDCRATIGVMRALGVRVEERSSTDITVYGVGLDGLQEPADVLDHLPKLQALFENVKNHPRVVAWYSR